MNKLFAIAPLCLLATACTVTNPVPVAQPVLQPAPVTTDKAYNRMAPEHYSCEDNASVSVKYSLDGEEAMLNGNLPKAKWMNQTLFLDIAPTASGMRYINSTVSDNVNYEWQAKGDIGLVTLTWADGSTYTVNCDRIGT